MSNKTYKNAMSELLIDYAQTLYIPTCGIRGEGLYWAYKDFLTNNFDRFGKLTGGDKLAVVWMYAQVKYGNVRLRNLTIAERASFQPNKLFQAANPDRCKNYEPYLDFLDLVASVA